MMFLFHGICDRFKKGIRSLDFLIPVDFLEKMCGGDEILKKKNLKIVFLFERLFEKLW